MGGPAGSDEAAKRCTDAIRHERLRMQARQGAAINKTVGPTSNMKPKTVVILLLGITILGGFARSSVRAAQDVLKVTVDLVNVQFSVTDRHGRFVPGLTAQDFKVEEDGRR